MEGETPLHLFYDCTKEAFVEPIERVYDQKTTAIPVLTTQSAFPGFNKLSEDYLLINHLILILKFCIYNARNKGGLNIAHLKAIVDITKNIEKKTSKSIPNKRSKYLKTAFVLLKIILRQCNGWELGEVIYFYVFLLLFLFFMLQMESR